MSEDKDTLPNLSVTEATALRHNERLVVGEPFYPILNIDELPSTADQREALPIEIRQHLRPEEKVVHIHEPEHIWPRRELTPHDVIFKALRAETADELGRKGPIVASVHIGEDDTKLSRYETEHGRDAEEAARHVYPMYPQVLDSVSVSLAESQGVEDEDYVPGKPYGQERLGSIILVNRHPDDPLAQKFMRRQGWSQPAYFSVDAPGLFLNGLYHLHVDKGDYLRERQYRPRDMEGMTAKMSLAFERAVDWLVKNSDEYNGLIGYRNEVKSGGMRHQGWRDGANSMVHRDGEWTNSESGVMPIEVQGEAFDAFQNSARIYRELFNDTKKADELDERAWRLFEIVKESGFKNGRFVSGFDWDHSQNLRPIDTTTSAAGRFLGSKIARLDNPEIQEMVEQTILRLFQEDMLTKWGLRTLSSSEEFYVPWAYHHGVWKYDTDNVAENLSELGFYGLDRILSTLTTAQYKETGVFYEHVSGDDSADKPVIPAQDIYVFNELYQELYLWMQSPPPGQTWSATSEIAKQVRHQKRPMLLAQDPKKSSIEKKIWDTQIPDDVKAVISLHAPDIWRAFSSQ